MSPPILQHFRDCGVLEAINVNAGALVCRNQAMAPPRFSGFAEVRDVLLHLVLRAGPFIMRLFLVFFTPKNATIFFFYLWFCVKFRHYDIIMTFRH